MAKVQNLYQVKPACTWSEEEKQGSRYGLKSRDQDSGWLESSRPLLAAEEKKSENWEVK